MSYVQSAYDPIKKYIRRRLRVGILQFEHICGTMTALVLLRDITNGRIRRQHAFRDRLIKY